MKNLLIVVFAVASLALGALWLKQNRTQAAAEQQLGSVRVELTQHVARVTELQSEQDRAAQEREKLVKLSDELGAELKARETAAAKKKAEALATKTAAGDAESPDAKNDFGKMISNMMKDPEMKKMIRGQQRMMMDQLYAPLAKKLSLSPEQTTQFKDLVADNMMNATEKATSMFGASTNRAEMMKEMEADQKAAEAKIKDLLGDDGFAQYQEYQLTVGERTQLNMFGQSAGGDHPLTEAQTEQLLALMREEKQNVATTTGQRFPGAGNDPASLEAVLSEEQSEKLMTAQQTVNQRVYDRASSILQPEQMEAFGKFQTNQLNMMRMGFGMARKMMAPAGGGSTPGS